MGASGPTRNTVAVFPPATAQKRRSGLRLMLTAAQSFGVRAPANATARGSARRCARGRTHSPLSGSLGPNGARKSIVLSPLLIARRRRRRRRRGPWCDAPGRVAPSLTLLSQSRAPASVRQCRENQAFPASLSLLLSLRLLLRKTHLLWIFAFCLFFAPLRVTDFFRAVAGWTSCVCVCVVRRRGAQ